jgi:hypothetical protein
MRFRLRTLMLAVTVGSIGLGWWIHWPQHTAQRFVDSIQCRDVHRASAMVADGIELGTAITMTIGSDERTAVESQPVDLLAYLSGRRRYTLKTPFGWCDFTVQRGQVRSMRDRYFYGGVEFVTVF